MITNALVQARQLYEDTDGVLVCDKYGYVEYLKWFHEGFLSDEAIGMHVTEVYPELDNQTSSIMRVIESGVPRFDERQVIHNCKGGAVGHRIVHHSALSRKRGRGGYDLHHLL